MMGIEIQQEIRKTIKDLQGKKILVIGDIGLDEYVLGDVRRISPEAPVPVLEVTKEDRRLGLAANVAQNVVSLGGEALLLSVIGQDSAGETVRQHLSQQGVSSQHLLVDPSRPTIRKLRVMAEHHHIVRVDYELKRYLSHQIEQQLMDRASVLLAQCHAVIIEDYAKGLLSETAMQTIIKASQKAGKKVVVDPHRSTPVHFYEGVDLMTPNRDEALALAGADAEDWRATSDVIQQLGKSLREKVKAEHLVITQGKEGMTLFDRDRTVHLPTFARQVFDVTGAGDTVIAALALGWAAGWSLEKSCVLANMAAGVVVGKIGCVPCTVDELLEVVERE